MVGNEIRGFLKTAGDSLNKHGVEYMLTGGAAVGFHGYQRISGGGYHGPNQMKHDLDFWYKPTVQNFEKLINALEDLGVDRKKLDAIIFDPKKTFLRIPQENFKMEFLPVLTGLGSYDDSVKTARKVQLDGNDLKVISYSDLIKNKSSMGREIDKKDIVELGKIHGKKK